MLNDEWSASEDVAKVEGLYGTADCISPNKLASHQIDFERDRPQEGGERESLWVPAIHCIRSNFGLVGNGQHKKYPSKRVEGDIDRAAKVVEDDDVPRTICTTGFKRELVRVDPVKQLVSHIEVHAEDRP